MYWQMRSIEGKKYQEEQAKAYEDKLRKVEREARQERNRIPANEEERIKKEKEDKQQDEFFRQLKEIAKGLSINEDEKNKKIEKRDELIKNQQEILRKQIELRMEGNLKSLSNINENEPFPDGVINDMVFLLTAHNLDWKNLVCAEMKINSAKLENIINFKIKEDFLRIGFIKAGKVILGI